MYLRARHEHIELILWLEITLMCKMNRCASVTGYTPFNTTQFQFMCKCWIYICYQLALSVYMVSVDVAVIDLYGSGWMGEFEGTFRVKWKYYYQLVCALWEASTQHGHRILNILFNLWITAIALIWNGMIVLCECAGGARNRDTNFEFILVLIPSTFIFEFKPPFAWSGISLSFSIISFSCQTTIVHQVVLIEKVRSEQTLNTEHWVNGKGKRRKEK